MRHPLATLPVKARWQETKPGSTKTTFHLTLDSQGVDIPHKVGDSLAVIAKNDPVLIHRVMEALKLDHAHYAALEHANLARVTPKLRALFHVEQNPQIDVIDLVEQQCGTVNAAEFIASLAPLLPRFYSIASSPKQHPDEIHLLVALTSFEHGAETRYGVASHFLCYRAEEVPCYVQAAPHFTLPASHDTPIIMVGPGTGVAPFRAFMQERLHLGASGKNWLFFGERHQKTDFFYADFWQPLVEKGHLALDCAFSRDHDVKTYVQHKLIEKGADIFAWLQAGAFLYVCGDADPMAKEVEAAVMQICQTHGPLSADEAKSFVRSLRREKRYLADVY